MAKLDTGLVAIGLGAIAIFALRKDVGAILKPVAGVARTAERIISLPITVGEKGAEFAVEAQKTRRLKEETRRIVAEGERQILVADVGPSVTRQFVSKGRPRRALASERVTQLRERGVLTPSKRTIGAVPKAARQVKPSKIRKVFKVVRAITQPIQTIVKKKSLKQRIFGKRIFARG